MLGKGTSFGTLRPPGRPGSGGASTRRLAVQRDGHIKNVALVCCSARLQG